MSYQREFEKRIPAAVIGVGSHSYRNILPIMNFLPVKLLAVCDVNEELAEKTAAQYACRAFTDTKEMYRKMPEIEAVFIAVGPKLHPHLAIEALAHGKHVWVEKPVSTTADEVRQIMEARKENEIVVVGLKKAFMPATVKAKEIIDTYGGLKSVLAVYHMNVPGNGEEILKNHETPNWLRNGVHPLAYMMALGGAVEEVTTIRNDEGYGAVILRFRNGVMGTLHLASGPSRTSNPMPHSVRTGSWTFRTRRSPSGAAFRSFTAIRTPMRRRALTTARSSGTPRTVLRRWKTRRNSRRASTTRPDTSATACLKTGVPRPGRWKTRWK
ncbi:MAG: Gfo/Idh/MocA family oxidoreductase [Lachnospiraceae bacterium]|nr:Gfo/Idh/MocA family oxidoreductase [Lachnospiraceae bacterium]